MTLSILEYVSDMIIGQGLAVVGVVLKQSEVNAVVTVQSILGTNPQDARLVLVEVGDAVLIQAIHTANMLKFELGRRFCLNLKQADSK
ncbi:hypothetical protein TUM17387_03100 [Shewanella carassii]|nr:hypothetical protein TUM17387_03100 [Shewanella carassii]